MVQWQVKRNRKEAQCKQNKRIKKAMVSQSTRYIKSNEGSLVIEKEKDTPKMEWIC